MERVAYMIKVRPDKIEEYKKAHSAVPPELTADLTAAGARNSSLWMGPDGLVFGYMECDNWESVRDHMSRTQSNRDWQALMHPLQEPPPGGSADDQWIQMLELLCLTE